CCRALHVFGPARTHSNLARTWRDSTGSCLFADTASGPVLRLRVRLRFEREQQSSKPVQTAIQRPRKFYCCLQVGVHRRAHGPLDDSILPPKRSSVLNRRARRLHPADKTAWSDRIRQTIGRIVISAWQLTDV